MMKQRSYQESEILSIVYENGKRKRKCQYTKRGLKHMYYIHLFLSQDGF